MNPEPVKNNIDVFKIKNQKVFTKKHYYIKRMIFKFKLKALKFLNFKFTYKTDGIYRPT